MWERGNVGNEGTARRARTRMPLWGLGNCGLAIDGSGGIGDNVGGEMDAPIDWVFCLEAQKKRPFQGVSPKMLSSGEYRILLLILYPISEGSSRNFKEIYGIPGTSQGHRVCRWL
jgi:hypothetical protein